MPIRSLNGLESTNVYVNTISDGEATEVEQITNSTQTKVNINFKSNTTETTSLNSNDLVLIADNSTGKIVKYITSDNFLANATNEWTLNSGNLYPTDTSTNVLVGTTTNSGSHKFLVSGTAKITSDLTLDTNIIKGGNTITLPSSAGTLALTSEIPTNNNQLTNGAGYITASSTDTLTNKTIDVIKNTNTRDILNYSSGNTNLTLGNSTDKVIVDGITTINDDVNIIGDDTTSGNLVIGLQKTSSNTDYNNATDKQLILRNISTDGNPLTSIRFQGIFQNNTWTKSKISSDDIGGYKGDLYFSVATASGQNFNETNLNEIMRITNTSRVGILTNAPTHTLHVVGNAKITSDLTLDANIIKGGNTITLPSSAGTLALTSEIPTNNNQLTNGEGYITASSTDTLTNKSISYSQLTGTPTVPTNNNQLTNGAGYITGASPELVTPKIFDGGSGIGQNYFYNIIPSQLTNNRNITLPVLSSNDEFVFKDATQTLTNKSISYSQLTSTPTIPTNNNQLTNGEGYITDSSTDTLTNKTLGDADFTGLTEFDTGNLTFIPYGSNGKFLIGNGTVGVRKPKISGMVTDTNSIGLLIQGANNNTNSGADMVFEIRQNSTSFGNDYTTTTGSGFRWDRYLTTLMTLTRDGKLGINTTTPSHKLHVDGTAQITDNLTLDANIIKGGNTITLPSSAGTLALTNNASFTGITNIDGSTRITLNVGDGFDFTANGTLQFGNNSGVGKSPTMMGVVSDANRAALQIIAASNNSNAAADLTFNVRESDGTDFSTTTGSGFSWDRFETSLMRLTRDAKLGIFTNAPSERLEVNGNIKTTGILTTNILSNNITFSPSGTSNNWYPTIFFDGNAQPFGSTIAGGAINNGGSFRNYCWAIESTTNSFRGLGLFTNNTDSYSFTNGANYTWMGFFTPFSKNTAYSFTASHRCYSDNNDLYNEDNIGLIVVSTGKYDSLYIDNINVDNAVPMVELCNKKKMKNVLGVIGKYEKDEDKRESMNFGYIQVCDKDKNRLYINSIGEGAIWVVNTNGDFENGDYIQTSDISGYGEKQDDDILHNYSVAKITMDVDFTNIPSGFKTKTLDGGVVAIMVGCIYQQG